MKSLLKKLTIGEWNIGISHIDFLEEFSTIKKGDTLILPVKWMKHNRRGSFFADPFIYTSAPEKLSILAEEFIFSRSKGVISICEVDRDSASMIGHKTILEETCHLSYPFFDSKSNCILPESFRNEEWCAYEFDGTVVSNKKKIADLKLIDATPVEHEGRKYVFATTQPNALSELLIYYFDDGILKAHPLNPVKDDIKSARCGGKFFRYNGSLYRVVQDSTHRYGESMHIMKILELTTTTFKEELYCDIELLSDGRYPLGFHTLNFDENVVIVDGYREVFRPFFAIFIYKILPILKKLGLHK